MQQQPPPAYSDDEISLKELIQKMQSAWRYLVSKWLIILASGIIGGLLGLGYAISKKPQYVAELTFALEESDKGAGAYAGLAAQFGFDLGGGAGGGAFAGDNLIELLKSRNMVQRTLLSSVKVDDQEITLADLYLKVYGMKQSWADNPELRDLSYPVDANHNRFSRAQDSVLGVVYNRIIKKDLQIAKLDKKLSIIDVDMTSLDEQFSKQFVQKLVQTVTDFYTMTKTGRSRNSVNALQFTSDSLRIELDRAMLGRAQSVDATPNMNPFKQVIAVSSQKKQVDIQVLSAAYTEVIKNLEISKMALMRDTPLIQIIDQPILPLKISRLGKGKGLVLGGVLAGIICVGGLLGRRLVEEIMK